jgi:N-acetylglutamate synthase-like GNAT family acetyltransferase
MPKIENPPEPGIRPARIQEAPELSDLCVRSKAVWGYNETFMLLARPALAVSPEQIDAGDVWVATDAQGSIAGLVALGPGNQAHALDLDKLFVEPQQIRAGFGRMLLMHAVAEARGRGARRLTILSDPYAAAFYERYGAIRIGMAPSDAVPGRMLPLFEINLNLTC